MPDTATNLLPERHLTQSSPLQAFWKAGVPALHRGKRIGLREDNTLACVFVQGQLSDPMPNPLSDSLPKAQDAPLSATLHFNLSSVPNRVSGEDPCCLWTAPDEWMVLSSRPAQQLVEQLSAALPDTFTVTNLSDSRCAIEISGEAAPLLLAKGCGLDFHPSVFGVGQCAQTLFDQVDIMIQPISTPRESIHAKSDGIGYRLLVARSHAAYLWRWLTDAAREFI